MADSPDLSKLVPGFDFLQGLARNAGSALPSVGQWVAPTMNPEEIEKRIGELRTVQFWLEQNTRMIAATIQALEVQRMTLSTLRTMNVQMGDLRDAMRIRMPGDASSSPAPAAAPEPAPAPTPNASATPASEGPSDKTEAPTAPGMVDPMQWWGALTKQFSQLATTALKDGAAEVTKNLPGASALAEAAAQVMQQVAKKAARKAAPARKRATSPGPASKKAKSKQAKSA